MPHLRSAVPVLLALVALAAGARAAITAPALELTAAEAASLPSGVLLRLEGSFPLGDLVQQPIELQVVVRETTQGTGFLRFALPERVFAGTSAALADGLDTLEVEALVAAGSPSGEARLLGLAPGRIELLLPPRFAHGPAEAQLLLVYRGEPLLSNPLPFRATGSTP